MRNRIVHLFFMTLLAAVVYSCGLWKESTVPAATVKPLGDTMKVNDGSLIYALPMTIFNISVEFKRTTEKPGPYSKYASEMLGLKDVITRENEKWSITRINVYSQEELDPSEFYVIESNNVVQINALTLKKTGLILDLNPALYESGNIQMTETVDGRTRITFNDMGADEYFMSHNDTAYRVVKLDTSFVKIPYLVERKKPLNIEQLADRAAKALLELRDGKQFILTGEANVFPQSSAGIDEINRLEREYTALFAGKTATELKSVEYTFIPKKEIGKNTITLFRFSETEGPLDVSSSGGSPVILELTPADKTKDITVVSRTAAEGENLQTFDKLYYRIPEVVTLKIKSGNRNYFESRKLVYQLGQVVQLPANYIIGK